jgi:hypothetical protein
MVEIVGNWINLTKYKGERFFYNIIKRNNKYILNKKVIDDKDAPWNSAEWINIDNNNFSGKYVYNNFIDNTKGLYSNNIIVWSDESISIQFNNTNHLNNILEGILKFYKGNISENMKSVLSKTTSESIENVDSIVYGIMENIIKTKYDITNKTLI